jgi:putative ABC transport system permease protein
VTLLRRSFFNLLRSPGRTGMVVAILAVSLGLALTMYEVHGATANQLGTISGQIGTDITVRPAGSSGFQSSSGTLLQTDVDKLNAFAHVVSVQSTTSTNYSGTVLTAAMPTSLPGGGNGRPVPTGGFRFSMPIQVQGLDPSNASPTLQGGGTLTMVSGAYFTADQPNANVMVIGQSLAEANSLLLGSNVNIEGTQVQVIGIFSSGQFFGDNTIMMPISTVQRLFNLDGVTLVTVQADDVSNVDAVVTEIRAVFDENTADVITATDMYARIGSSITNAATSSQTGMIVSFIVAAAVILLAVLLVVRQRVREIGVLKAIGASNWRIGFQFGLETLMLSVVAAVVGTGLTFVFAQKVADLFTSGGTAVQGGNPFGGGPRGGFGGGIGVISGNIGGIHVAISPEIFVIALGVALVLALVASVVPVWYIARVRPAEVLRNE